MAIKKMDSQEKSEDAESVFALNRSQKAWLLPTPHKLGINNYKSVTKAISVQRFLK